MIWAVFCNRFWEIYDRGTSLSCMHTNCVQKLEPGRCSGLLNPEYRICSQLTLYYVKKTDTYFRFHREISIKMYRTSRLRCKKHIKMVIFTEFLKPNFIERRISEAIAGCKHTLDQESMHLISSWLDLTIARNDKHNIRFLYLRDLGTSDRYATLLKSSLKNLSWTTSASKAEHNFLSDNLETKRFYIK